MELDKENLKTKTEDGEGKESEKLEENGGKVKTKQQKKARIQSKMDEKNVTNRRDKKAKKSRKVNMEQLTDKGTD